MKVTRGRIVDYCPRREDADILPIDEHCTAIVRSVVIESTDVVHLFVLHPAVGTFDIFDVPPGQEGTRCYGQPGTWHWPEREPAVPATQGLIAPGASNANV